MANNSLQKTIMIFIAFALSTVTTPGLAAAKLENKPVTQNTAPTKDKPMTKPNNKTLVIYYSRSGNTELMAMTIAKYYGASVMRLEADDYRLGFRGLLNAVKDAGTRHAVITPENIDLSTYETIFIGTPIWWYSPAPPVWQFIENNQLAHKSVVLFSTFNSSFKEKYIDEFAAKVKNNGGHFIDHIYVKRGRISQQIDDKTLSEKTREVLDKLRF